MDVNFDWQTENDDICSKNKRMRAFNDLHGTLHCSKQRKEWQVFFFYSVASIEYLNLLPVKYIDRFTVWCYLSHTYASFHTVFTISKLSFSISLHSLCTMPLNFGQLFCECVFFFSLVYCGIIRRDSNSSSATLQ